MKADYTKIIEAGGSTYGDYSFVKCGHCGAIALHDNEHETIYLNPHDLHKGKYLYALSDVPPVVCPSCGKENSYDDEAGNDDLECVKQSGWAFALKDDGMKPQKIGAYQFIANKALLELKWQSQRCCNVIPLFAGLSRRYRRKLKCISHHSVAFHNLAIALQHNRMDTFDEESFWDGVQHLQNEFGDLLFCDYRDLFEKHLNGEQIDSLSLMGGVSVTSYSEGSAFRNLLFSCIGLDPDGIQAAGLITTAPLEKPDDEKPYKVIRQMLLDYDWKSAVKNERFRSFAENTVQWFCLYRIDGSASVAEVSLPGELWQNDRAELLIAHLTPEEVRKLLPHIQAWTFLIPDAKIPERGKNTCAEVRSDDFLNEMSRRSDFFCRIYIDSGLEKNHLEELLTEFCARPLEHGSASLPWGNLDLDENSDFDESLKMKNDAGFLYFKFILWVERNERSCPEKYKKHIAGLLELLWNKGFEAVCACDFEDELPYSGGIKRLASKDSCL